jgi:hypothetical protein
MSSLLFMRESRQKTGILPLAVVAMVSNVNQPQPARMNTAHAADANE